MQAEGLAHELDERYAGGVTVEYVDVYSPEMFETYPEILRMIATRGLPLPLISIAGQPRFVGGISSPMICQALDELGLSRADTSRA